MSNSLNTSSHPENSAWGRTGKSSVDRLIEFGLLLVAVVTLLSANFKLPPSLTLIVEGYLVIVTLTILASPAKTIFSKLMSWIGTRRSAKKMRPELLELVAELTQLVDQQRADTLPFVVAGFSSRLSDDGRSVLRLDRNLDHIGTLHAWAHSLFGRFVMNKKTNFWENAADLTHLVLQLSWAYVRMRDIVNLTPNYDGLEVLNKLKPDWDEAVRKISDYTSRVERFAKSVNSKYGTTICTTSFQQVKTI